MSLLNTNKISTENIEDSIIESNSQGTLEVTKKGEGNWLNNIGTFDPLTTPSSSVSVFLGKRRSGKSYLCEFYINQLVKNKQLDIIYVFSETGAGFESIDPKCKFTEISKLINIIENMKKINQYNKVVNKREKIKLQIMIVIDDMALKLKSKEFEILETIATNGRHYSYPPLSMHFCILSQSLTKIPRTVRLNCDYIYLNAISSAKEKELVFDENLYVLASSINEKREARKIYEDIIFTNDFQFMVIENYKQNIKSYSDYLKAYRAD